MTQGSQSAGALSLSMSCSAIPSSNVATIDFISGEEAISAPYAFEITFTTFSALKPADVVGKPIQICIKPGPDTLVANGVIFTLFTGDPTLNGNFVYRAVIVPNLKLLDLNERNQIFGTQNQVKLAGPHRAIAARHADGQSNIKNAAQPNIEFEIPHPWLLSDDRLYRPIWRERPRLSVSALRSRRHLLFLRAARGRVRRQRKGHFQEYNQAFDASPLDHASYLPYAAHQTVAVAAYNTAISFCALARALPEKVYLRDYNPQSPSVDLLSNAAVNNDGFGNFVEYGDNFAKPEQGEHLAEVGAQEIACRANVFRGVSTAPQLRAGYIFTLKDHPDTAMDGRYVVIKVKHQAGNAWSISFGRVPVKPPRAITTNSRPFLSTSATGRRASRRVRSQRDCSTPRSTVPATASAPTS